MKEFGNNKVGQGEAVAFLDIGAGGYVDLGTDQTIEALEKLPYGRHMLGIIGTYGADGWKPSPSQPATKSEPVGYAAFSDNGKIRVWSLEPGVIEMMAAQGCKAVPLYTAPPATADAVSVPRELLERTISNLLYGSARGNAEELRVLLAGQEV